MIQSGLAFVISNVEIEGELPQEVYPSHVFRRANEKEIDAIHKILDSVSVHSHNIEPIPYRHIIRVEKSDSRSSFHHEEIPRENWRCWIIAFERTNLKVRDIEHVAFLLPIDLDIGLTIFFSVANQLGSVSGWCPLPLHLIEKYTEVSFRTENAKKLHSNDIASIPRILESMECLPEEAGFVKRAIENYCSVRSIPGKPEIRVVGYFAIIESLITHAPRLTETLDSINHQIVHKIVSLRKRFRRNIPYESYFLAVNENRLWKLLYAYRSYLAHGEKPDFSSKFQSLKSGANVTSFLKEIIKELILIGLTEPIFLTDLKKC
jgi:hypothetical protein